MFSELYTVFFRSHALSLSRTGFFLNYFKRTFSMHLLLYFISIPSLHIRCVRQHTFFFAFSFQARKKLSFFNFHCIYLYKQIHVSHLIFFIHISLVGRFINAFITKKMLKLMLTVWHFCCCLFSIFIMIIMSVHRIFVSLTAHNS